MSFETAEYTANGDAVGTLRMLRAIRILRLEDTARFYQASTSKLYGEVAESPDDFVLATGETHSVREFVELSFTTAGRRIEWRGTGTDECGFDAANGDVLVGVDTRYFRPTEVAALHGDPSKACSVLGWHHKTGFEDLAKEMVAADLAAANGNCGPMAPEQAEYSLDGKRVWVAGHRGR